MIGYQLYINRLGTYLLKAEHDAVEDSIARGLFWEAEIKPTLDNLKSSDIVVEVGSFIGDHTIYMSKRCAKVYAYEGTTKNYYQLCANLLLNDCTNVVTQNKCMGKDNSKIRQAGTHPADPFPPAPNNMSGIHYILDTQGDRQLYTLDDELSELDRLDLLKTDCEGMDLDVLMGAENTIKRFLPTILFEINTAINKLPDEVYTGYLESFGYTVTKLGHWNWLAKMEA